VKKVGAQLDEITIAMTHSYKRRKLLDTDLKWVNENELELQGKLVETKASIKKAKDDVSLLEREVADLDATPRLPQKKQLRLKQQRNVSKNF